MVRKVRLSLPYPSVLRSEGWKKKRLCLYIQIRLALEKRHYNDLSLLYHDVRQRDELDSTE